MARIRIFISYRRDDSRWVATSIHSELARRFPGKVFMDVDAIAAGVDFVQRLKDQVEQCDVLVALIGPQWATPALRERNNFVRIEIEQALDCGVTIVPVLIDDAEMPATENVPPAIDALLTRQAIRLRRDSFAVDIGRLADALRNATIREKKPIVRGWRRWTRRAPEPADAIETAFAERVHRDVLEAIRRDPDQLGVTTLQRRELSVMFSDIAGFTSFSERMQAGEMSFIADLHTPITDVIIRRRGAVDKYLGDSVLAFWNAPVEDRTHAANACAAALDMDDAMTRLNGEFSHRGAPPIHLLLAISTGPCIVGPLGSRRRFEYSCFGDSVNLASRLVNMTKEYGFPRLIDQNTADAVRHHFALLELDAVPVRGMARKLLVHALIGDDSIRVSPDFLRLTKQFTIGREALESADAQAAADAFNAAADISIDGVDTGQLCRAAAQRARKTGDAGQSRSKTLGE